MKRINKPRRTIHAVDELPYICNSAEVGLLLRKNPETVNAMARKGELPGAKQGREWVFRRDDVVLYMNRLFTEGVTR